MSEEIRNEVVEEIVPVEYEDDYEIEEAEYEGSGIGKFVFAGGALLVGGATALAIKNKNKLAAKLEERRIRKMEAKGYTVIKPENVVDESEVVDVDTDEFEN